MKLFEPGKIGRLAIKNRIVMAPMGMGPLADSYGRFSQRLIDHYTAPARGGTGLIITGITRVSREIETQMYPRIPTVNEDMHIERLSELADAVHDYGAKIAIQFTAGFGRVAPERYLKGDKPVSASAVPYFWNPRITTRELTTEEVERLVKDFEFAARLVSVAGIDAVELHAHEGYIFDQFLTKLWNKRTDKYGGSFENRLRFSLEVIEAIKKGAGSDFPVIYRFGLKHYIEGGREIEESLEIARRLEAAGVDALEVDAGCYETWEIAHPPTYQPRGFMVDMAEAAKKVVKIPVIAVGKLGYPVLAEKVLQDGKADFICIGRALLADQEWANKVKEGRTEDIRPCIGDHEGCMGRLYASKYTSCTVNPMAGMERELALKPAEIKKSVLIIGGGPAGMEAAQVAALRGHEVTLWEKNDALGGNLIPAAVPDFKQDYRDLIQYFTTQLRKLGVKIELQKEATLESVQKMKPQVVFVATGAVSIIPDIPGAEKRRVLSSVDVLLGKKEVGESVVVVGGGLVGCELAVYLAQKGKKVTIVEILDGLARDAFKSNRVYLLQMLSDARVKILTETRTVEMIAKGVIVADKNDKRNTLEIDSVVCALGLKSCDGLAEVLPGKVPEVYAIGDCVEPRKVINAIWEGFRLARLI